MNACKDATSQKIRMGSSELKIYEWYLNYNLAYTKYNHFPIQIQLGHKSSLWLMNLLADCNTPDYLSGLSRRGWVFCGRKMIMLCCHNTNMNRIFEWGKHSSIISQHPVQWDPSKYVQKIAKGNVIHCWMYRAEAWPTKRWICMGKSPSASNCSPRYCLHWSCDGLDI